MKQDQERKEEGEGSRIISEYSEFFFSISNLTAPQPNKPPDFSMGR